MTRLFLVICILCSLLIHEGRAQAPVRWSSSEIHHAIQKLQVLGSAMYIAAHPDDENTRLISYLSNDLKVNTTYLSVTRGDGGQNLIGPEMRELLGVIRTQELLAARSIDGGQQRFTRANDFGYSKTPDETLVFWDEDAVLSDMVLAIRQLQPDILINRFPHEHLRGNHGHHTTSAMLSMKAFDLAGDPDAFPGHFAITKPWQPRRLFFNTSWWFYGSRENFEKADKTRLIQVDGGRYYPLLGYSNSEISAASRSMHKSQGFGSVGSRSRYPEYLELKKGDLPEDRSLFSGIDMTWERIEGGRRIKNLLEDIEAAFDHTNPAASVEKLVSAWKEINTLPDSHWKEIKAEEVKTIIQQCMGLYLEAVSPLYWACPGDSLGIDLEVTNRSGIAARITTMHFPPTRRSIPVNQDLDNAMPWQKKVDIYIPKEFEDTSPYWLSQPWEEGMYQVEDLNLRGLPETPSPTSFQMDITILDMPFTFDVPIVFKKRDPVIGELYRPFEIVPPVAVRIGKPVYVFGDGSRKTISVQVRSNAPQIEGELTLQIPKGWKVTPEKIAFAIRGRGAEQQFTFDLIAPGSQDVGYFHAACEINQQVFDQEIVEIVYDHIPAQTVLRKAKAKIVKVDIQKEGGHVAYLMGAGDDIPESLEQIGYKVDLIKPEDINAGSLEGYDAVILGIRAYNTLERLRFKQDFLFDYVENGGNMIVQYNTTRGLKVDQLAPYPLELSRDRVTDEYAEVSLLAADHPVLNTPNKITKEDFNDWVQERGLYFPDQWDAAFTPVLSAHDPGEEPKQGGLLVAKYGEGYFVYTGYSWFRQLPAGVPGAYRIFANMISLGQNGKS